MRVLSVSPRGADAVGSLLRGERRLGKHVRKGEIAIRVHAVQLL